MTDMEWSDTGYPAPEPATDRQKGFLQSHGEAVAALMTDSEKLHLETVQDDAEWLNCLSKARACELISEIMRPARAPAPGGNKWSAYTPERAEFPPLMPGGSCCGGTLERSYGATFCPRCGRVHAVEAAQGK